MKMNLKTTVHKDGSVTYWSVYRQQWIKKAPWVPHQELAAMNERERNRIIKKWGILK